MDAGTAWWLSPEFSVDVYAEAPDYITTDPETNFNPAEFKNQVSSIGSILKVVLTKAHEQIGLTVQGHANILKVFKKLRIVLPHIKREGRLSVAFRAINDTLNKDFGTFPTTLVFGVYPKIPDAGVRKKRLQIASTIRECTYVVTKIKEKRTVRDAMKRHNTASCKEMQKVFQLPSGHDVLVYRENEGWKRFTRVRVRAYEVDVVLLSGKISTFALNCVRSDFADDEVQPSRVEHGNGAQLLKKQDLPLG